jgi:hypothetical protein
MTAAAGFVFNRNYKDLEQVEEFLPAFEARLRELEAAGQYRHNDAFKGHIPGIEGPCEDTAIYLLQGLERERRTEEKIERLLSEGYEWLDEIAETTKFRQVALVQDHRVHKGGWAHSEGARVMPNGGKPYVVIPKGKRTHGTLINGRRVLVLR